MQAQKLMKSFALSGFTLEGCNSKTMLDINIKILVCFFLMCNLLKYEKIVVRLNANLLLLYLNFFSYKSQLLVLFIYNLS